MELFNGIIFLTGVMLAIAYGKKQILFVNVKQTVLSCINIYIEMKWNIYDVVYGHIFSGFFSSLTK